MTLTIHNELEQGTPEWLEARRGLLTASTIGRLITPTLKVADNETSCGLIYTLAAERITGHIEPVYVTADMQRGSDDEPFARDAYAKHYNVQVEQVGFMVLEEPGYTLGFSPDGLVGDNGLIEIKSRKPKEHLRHVLSGKPPAENMAQMQTGLLITGRDWCDYISFSAGLPLWPHRVYPDPDWFEVIEAAVAHAEKEIRRIVDDFHTATDGLAPTERRPDYTNLELI